MNLFAYQEKGVATLEANKRFLLADDMGLGKTPQLICAVDNQFVGEPLLVLVVCPNTLKWNWEIEINNWCKNPHTVYLVDGKTQEDKADKALFPFLRNKTKPEIHFLVINYESINFWLEALRFKWGFIVVDEAHKLKNRKSKNYENLKILNLYTSGLYLATGTPFLNRTSDIWTLLNLIDKKNFSAYWKFAQSYCDVGINYEGHKHLTVTDILDPSNPKVKALHKALAKYMLRRTKKEVRPDLPPKIITPVYLELPPEQRKIYGEMEEEMCTKVDDKYYAANITIAQIIRLIQISISHKLLNPASLAVDGIKQDAALEIIESLGNEKIVVFSQWESVTTRLRRKLEAQGYPWPIYEITGNVTGEERQKGISAFQTGAGGGIMLCTIAAGGVGVTLTASANLIFMDKCLVPKINEQAEDRLCRHGQERTVNVYNLITRNTIEEDVYDLLYKKDYVVGINLGEVTEIDNYVIENLQGKILSRRLTNE